METKKISIKWGFVASLIILSTFCYFTLSPSVKIEEWHVIIESHGVRAAEPDAGQYGWLATFLYDYAENPDQMDNGTWYASASNVSGYIQNDGGQDEVASEHGSYIVVRVKFDKDQCYDGDDSQFVHTRTKCHLTTTGLMDGEDLTSEPGSYSLYANAVANNSGGTNLYINFYWDDGVDGYKIPDDGTMAWNITVYAKY